MSFVHLNVHSEYSLIDGLVKIKPLFAQAAQFKQPAVAITDAMNLFAAVKAYRVGLARGVKPIFGACLLIAGDQQTPNSYLNVLCQNNQGFKALSELVSRAYREGERPDTLPLIKREWLTVDSLQGLIALSAASVGDIGMALVQGQSVVAKQRLNYWLSLFPNQCFYLEVQRTDHSEDESCLQGSLDLAVAENLPVVATQKVRFLKEQDFAAHEVRVAIHDGFTLEDPKRPKPYTPVQFLCSTEAMQERFADLPELLENTVELAKRCNVTFDLGKPCLPNFPVPEGMSVDEYLIQTSEQGLKQRLALIENLNAEQQKVYEDRLKIELNVIIKMGFPGYFLIVADFIQWSKDNGVPVGPGRGSGAGSLVAYALKITDLDPIPYDLLFERFLNPERISMPDFDVDFCMDGRDRVIEYVAQKYGRDSVSQIITYGSMAAKAVVRDVGRVLGHGYGFVDSIAKLIPMDLGMTLTLALEQEPDLKDRYDNEEEVKALIDMALQLEGTVRNVGKHAGGVVISPSLLTDFCPVYCEQGSDQLVSQFDKDDVEAIGLVKFDFLGLRNLTIIDAAIDNIQALNPNEPRIDINQIPLDDVPTFDLLKDCKTTAVFQLESRGMKDLINRLQPDCFEDIVALVALFRPGPLQSGMVDDFIDRKHGRAEVEYPHPDTESILKPTYGIILYQEQVMMIPQVLAGYTLGGADILRRAMGKKKPEEMAKQRQVFMEGALKNNIKEETATYIFDLMEKFAGYGFNKSHSAAYALIAYQTAWLKAHHKAAFMAAVLSSDMDNTDKVVNFVEDCKDIGVNLLPPDINQSHYRFTVADQDSVRFGLGAIKGAGGAALDLIIAEREQNGAFRDLFTFCRRLDGRKVNKRVLEALICSGAMDQLGPSRSDLLASIECAMHYADQCQRNRDSGQNDLFGGEDNAQAEPPAFVEGHFLPQQLLLQEKAVLGFFISGHPMHEAKAHFEQLGIRSLGALRPTKRGDTLKTAGFVVGFRKLITKRGSLMGILSIDDGDHRIEVTVFAEALDRHQALLKLDQILVVDAEVSPDQYSGGLRVNAQHIVTLPQALEQRTRAIEIYLDQRCTPTFLQNLKQVLEPFKGGGCQLRFNYDIEQVSAKVKSSSQWNLEPNEACLEQLGILLKAQGFEYKACF